MNDDVMINGPRRTSRGYRALRTGMGLFVLAAFAGCIAVACRDVFRWSPGYHVLWSCAKILAACGAIRIGWLLLAIAVFVSYNRLAGRYPAVRRMPLFRGDRQ